MTTYTGMTFEIKDVGFNEDMLVIQANNLDGHISITEVYNSDEDTKNAITIGYFQLDQVLQVLKYIQKVHGTANRYEKTSQ